MITLRSHDELSASFSFELEASGLELQGDGIRNRDSDLFFDRWGDEVLSVGRQGSTLDSISDLGDPRLQGTLMSAFFDLEIRNGRIGSNEIADEAQRWQELAPPISAGTSLPVKRGHCYAVTIQQHPNADAASAAHYLLRVIGYAHDDHVVLRWRRL